MKLPTVLTDGSFKERAKILKNQLDSPKIEGDKAASRINSIGCKLLSVANFTSEAPRNWKVALVSCAVCSCAMAGCFVLLAPVSAPLAIVASPLFAHAAQRTTVIALNKLFEKVPEQNPKFQQAYFVSVIGSVGSLIASVAMSMALPPGSSFLLSYPITEMTGGAVRFVVLKVSKISYEFFGEAVETGPVLETLGDAFSEGAKVSFLNVLAFLIGDIFQDVKLEELKWT